MESTNQNIEGDNGLSAARLRARSIRLHELVHNMNNYLLTAGGTADLLKRRCGEQPEVVDRLDKIQQAVEQISRMARQATGVLDRVREEKGEWSLGEAISRVVDDHPEWDAARRLVVRESDGASQRVAFSLPHLCFVIEAVLENAFEASPADQSVSISERIQLVEQDSDGAPVKLRDGVYAVLEIEDHGPGLAYPDVEEAFDPFSSTKDPSRGTGLFMSRKFLQKQRGGLLLESAPGGGTKALLYFFISDM